MCRIDLSTEWPHKTIMIPPSTWCANIYHELSQAGASSLARRGAGLGNTSRFLSADHTSSFFPTVCHQTSSIAASTPTSSPSHRRIRQNPRIRHATHVHHGSFSCRMTGPAQRTTLPPNLPRYVPPYHTLMVLQVNIFRISSHQAWIRRFHCLRLYGEPQRHRP